MKEEEEDEEEKLAEEKLKQLQELAEKSVTEGSTNQPSSSSSSSKACLKSTWEQIGNLLVYTAAGVRGSDKVGVLSVEEPMIVFIYVLNCKILFLSNHVALTCTR